LKQMVPAIARVALVFNPATSPQFQLYQNALEAAAPALGLDVITAPIHSTNEIETTLARLARDPNIGLIFPPTSFTIPKPIVEPVARYRLRAIYGQDDYASEGGLMSYFNDLSEKYRLAPFYIDRTLKGTKPGGLPVHLPTNFKFMVNRKTAA